MNTKEKKNKIIHTTNESWNRAAAKGALVWGTVYSTATTGAACLLAPAVTGGSLAVSDVFMDSLVIFPTAGAARGLVLWRMNKNRPKGHKRPWRVHHKKAA